MTKSSVSINKVAILRSVRGGDTPNVVKVVLDYEAFGIDGVTVHPRPDGRHTRRTDVHDLRPLSRTEFNIEGYPSSEFIDLVLKVKPHQMTLVPDDSSQITSNSSWDTEANLEFLSEVLGQFNSAGIRTSIFITADPEMVGYTAKTGTDRVGLYTGSYTTVYPKNSGAAAALFVEAAKTARRLGIGLNTGYGSNLVNLSHFYENIPWVGKVSIGHALISDALCLKLERTIQKYKNCLH